MVIDHNNEETVREVLDRGFWAAFTIYPKTKMGNERMVEVVRQYGSERIIVDSSADWGVSDPMAVPKVANLMAQRGIAEHDIHMSCYTERARCLRPERAVQRRGLADPGGIDQRTLFEGNSVLRGQAPRVDEDAPAKDVAAAE